MNVITARRLVLQFDGDQITHGTPREELQQALRLINLQLQREPFGLGAQLFLDPDHCQEDITAEEIF